jgi:hypothetical protein
LCAEFLDVERDLNKIGQIISARITERGDFVDIYTEARHVGMKAQMWG